MVHTTKVSSRCPCCSWEIELDPASNEQANCFVRARTFYDLTTDGLKNMENKNSLVKPALLQTGNTSNQAIWTAKLLAEYKEAT